MQYRGHVFTVAVHAIATGQARHLLGRRGARRVASMGLLAHREVLVLQRVVAAVDGAEEMETRSPKIQLRNYSN